MNNPFPPYRVMMVLHTPGSHASMGWLLSRFYPFSVRSAIPPILYFGSYMFTYKSLVDFPSKPSMLFHICNVSLRIEIPVHFLSTGLLLL